MSINHEAPSTNEQVIGKVAQRSRHPAYSEGHCSNQFAHHIPGRGSLVAGKKPLLPVRANQEPNGIVFSGVLAWSKLATDAAMGDWMYFTELYWFCVGSLSYKAGKRVSRCWCPMGKITVLFRFAVGTLSIVISAP